MTLKLNYFDFLQLVDKGGSMTGHGGMMGLLAYYLGQKGGGWSRPLHLSLSAQNLKLAHLPPGLQNNWRHSGMPLYEALN